jgi:uncharacterized membrane protein YkoI
MMRIILTLIAPIVVAVLLASPALAEKGGNGSGNKGNGIGNGGSSADASNGNASSNGNGQGGGNDVETIATDRIVVVPNDQSVARDAVRSRAALPLETITEIVNRETDGRILDLQLATFNGMYLYDVTVLETNGVLHKLYYYARSGVRVRTN